jgi:hypothetical protein
MARRHFPIYAIALMLAGCTAPVARPVADESSQAQPQTLQAAEAAVQKELDLLQRDDFAGLWLMTNDEGRSKVSQADFVRLNATCNAGIFVVRFTITSGRLLAPDKALITTTELGADVYFTMDYEHGQWLSELDPQELAEYAEGVDKAIADRKAIGGC